MISLPAPQKSTIPMVLSARFVAPLGPGSVYDFSKLPEFNLVNVSSAYLYRILSYSFATELPESSYSAALISNSPVSFEIKNTGNKTSVLAKPVPVPVYVKDSKYLQYFQVTQSHGEIHAKLSGKIDGSIPELIGYASIAAVLSFSVQCIVDDEWTNKYERGEM